MDFHALYVSTDIYNHMERHRHFFPEIIKGNKCHSFGDYNPAIITTRLRQTSFHRVSALVLCFAEPGVPPNPALPVHGREHGPR